jgi:ribosomal 50S subunit-associated protein YjgA (DUF615 family)
MSSLLVLGRMLMRRPPDAIVNLKLRLEERLRRRLEAAARRNDHSMNAEIIALLDDALDRPPLKEDLVATVTKTLGPESEVVKKIIAEINEVYKPLREQAETKDLKWKGIKE